MSLDLHKIAGQIQDVASDLNANEGDRESRLERALSTLTSAQPEALEKKRVKSRANFSPIAGLGESMAGRYPYPALPSDYTVLAVDGSHIDVDRHLAVQCYLINMGTVHIRYGLNPEARLGSEPRLYTDEDSMHIIDPEGNRTQSLEGQLLGELRAVEELRTLATLAKETDPDIPALALIDGSLILWGLVGQTYPDFVRRVLMDDIYLPALDELREMAKQRPLALASYISLPRSADVVNVLRLDAHQCPYDVSNCDDHCGSLRPGQRPCDAVSGVVDRDVLGSLLDGEERSDSFINTSVTVERYYGEHAVHFYYLNAGAEMARVEVPAWVAESPELLELSHAMLIDQCRKGHGYPIAISEAHEQAVVTTKDREEFQLMLEGALQDHRLPVYTSQKNFSKRMKWL
jgi:hypothetical protein